MRLCLFHLKHPYFPSWKTFHVKDFVDILYEWFTHKFYELYSCFFITYMHAFLVSCVLLNKCSVEHITKFSPNWLKTVGFTEKVHWAYIQNTLTLINISKVNTKLCTKTCTFCAVGQKIWVKLPTIKFNEDQFSSSQAVSCSQTYNS